METTTSSSDDVKALALDGNLDAIVEKFGKKKCVKAEDYIKVKLDALAEKVKRGFSLATVSYATPFMMFALGHRNEDLIEVGKAFGASKADDGETSDLTSPTPPSQQKNTPSQASNAEENSEKNHEAGVAVVSPPVKRAPSVPVRKGFQPPSAGIQKDIETSTDHDKSSKKSSNSSGKRKSSKEAKDKVEKKQKKEKDIDAPKAAKSSYLFFAAHVRSEILAAEPNRSMVEVAKETGARWRELSDEDKKPFLEQAERDKQRYQEEMATYRETHPGSSSGSDVKTGKAARTKTKDGTKKDKAGKRSLKQQEAVIEAAEEQVEGVSKKGGDQDGEPDSAQEEEVSAAAASTTARSSQKRKAAIVAEVGIAKSSRGESSSQPTSDRVRSSQEDSHHRQRHHHHHKDDHHGYHDEQHGHRSAMKGQAGKHDHKASKAAPEGDEEDWSTTDFKPHQKVDYPPALDFRKGMAVVLVLEPYRTFLSQLPADAVDEVSMQEIQRVCTITAPSVQCTVKSSRSVPCGEDVQVPPGEVAPCYSLLTLTAGGRDYKVLHADLSSPLLTCDVFLVESRQFQESMKAPWLIVNAQVKRLFATEDPDIAEYQEGSIYYIRENMHENPYGAVKVAWLEQERRDDTWIYAPVQTDSDCSPWELELSSYVLLQNIRPPLVPRSLMVGTLDPHIIIEHLKTFDAAGQFMLDMSKTDDPNYIALFPSVESCWDLPRITRLCRQGRYSAADNEAGSHSTGSSKGSRSQHQSTSNAELGILTLFLDLQRMVAQSKRYNACNALFLPWRMADMMECAVHRLKRALAEERGIACLQRSLEEDQQEKEQLAASNQAAAV